MYRILHITIIIITGHLERTQQGRNMHIGQATRANIAISKTHVAGAYDNNQ